MRPRSDAVTSFWLTGAASAPEATMTREPGSPMATASPATDPRSARTRLTQTWTRFVPPALTLQLVRFGVIGVASTIAHAALFLALRPALGSQIGNFTALLICAVLNTAANRRFTFGVRGRHGLFGQHGQALILFLVTWAMTGAALAVYARISPDSSAVAEAMVLLLANAVATLVRFTVLRRWIFRAS